MLIFKPENAKGFSEVQHTCLMLEWDEECENLSKVNLGEKTYNAATVAVRVILKERGKCKLPDFFYSNSHPIISTYFRDALEGINFNDVEFIPTTNIGARIESRSGAIEDVSIQEAGIEIDRDYFVLNIPFVSHLLDRNATTMSNEFISRENEAHPGTYIQAIFQTHDVPPLFVLPGRPFGLLLSEKFVKLAKTKKLKGLRAIEIMDTTKPNFLNMYPTDSAHIVTMAEAWRQYELVHA